MILATHALIGAAIGSKIKNPWLIIPVALAVHYFLDTFRHGEYFDERTATIKNTYKKVALDLSVASVIILSFIYFEKLNFAAIRNILIGSFFSLLPDSLTLINYWKPEIKIFAKIKEFHTWAHMVINKIPKHAPERQWKLKNATNDILFSVLAILLLFI